MQSSNEQLSVPEREPSVMEDRIMELSRGWENGKDGIVSSFEASKESEPISVIPSDQNEVSENRRLL